MTQANSHDWAQTFLITVNRQSTPFLNIKSPFLSCVATPSPHVVGPREAHCRGMASSAAGVEFRAVAAAVYRRLMRQAAAVPRQRVRGIVREEVRREFASPPSECQATRARAMARSMLALTWLKRASADPRSTEGELLWTLVGQYDSLNRRRKMEDRHPQRRKRRLEKLGGAERAVVEEVYGPLVDVIGVRGVMGEYWAPE